MLVSPSVSQELVQGRIQTVRQGAVKRNEHPLPPTPPSPKTFFQKFSKKKNDFWFWCLVGLVGYQVSWLEMMPWHASSKQRTVLVSPNASQELVQGRIQPRDEDLSSELNIPPPPLLQKRFSKSFPKKKQMIFGFDVCWLGGLSSLVVGDDASGHASSKWQTVLVSPSASQELVQGRNLASRWGSIKQIEYPIPSIPLP